MALKVWVLFAHWHWDSPLGYALPWHGVPGSPEPEVQTGASAGLYDCVDRLFAIR